jgi:predicted nucleotidyltransferase
MATTKPTTAAGYSADQTLACERALISLLRGLGTIKHSLRLVGGLVPRYLTPEMPPAVPAHAGTSDVDIVLNLQLLADGDAYRSLADQLKAQGFERAVNHQGRPTGWRWQRQVAKNEYVVIEFLRDADEKLAPGKVGSVEGESISALAIKHVGIVHDWYAEREITAELPDGAGNTTETVRFADVTAFIVLKALAYDDRHENKDAADLVHVMRYAGTLEAVAAQFIERIASGKYWEATDAALDVLKRRFCDTKDIEGYLRDGPIAAARFLHTDLPQFEEQRVLEQRNVSGLIAAFIDLVAEGRDTLAATSMQLKT